MQHLHVKVPDDQYQAFTDLCERQGWTVAWAVRRLMALAPRLVGPMTTAKDKS
jgi:hypothetical protein